MAFSPNASLDNPRLYVERVYSKLSSLLWLQHHSVLEGAHAISVLNKAWKRTQIYEEFFYVCTTAIKSP